MPKIDARNFQELFDERKSVASFYTPEWNVDAEKDVGVVLLKIFTHMQEEIISRLNRMPEKNFVAFLDMLGIKLMPAQPAKVPVTFYLAGGTPGGAFVPAGTQIATAETEEQEALTFETTDNFFATSATIHEIYCVDPGRDVILSHRDILKAKIAFTIFDADKENLQEHVLYLGHGNLFSLKEKATIKLKIEFISGNVKDLADLTWEYWGEDDKNPERFIVTTEENSIVLRSKGELKEKEINGITCRWIQCRLDRISDKYNLPVINKIQIHDVAPEKYIKPDLGFYNSIPMDLTTEFYPFSTQPRLFDTFFIASREAFSKKKAKLKVTFKREAEKPAPKPTDVMLSWEYWNGVLWLPLKIKENKINDFILEKEENGDSKGYIVFYCAEDFEEAEVNGQKDYWIRVRLIKGDYGKEEFEQEDSGLWVVKPNFVPPLISDVDIEYSFDEEIDLQHCLAYNNLEYSVFTQESKGDGYGGFKPFIPIAEKRPTFYLGFNEAFKKGNISIFFSLVEKFYPVDARPEIKWTYWHKASNLSKDMKNSDEVNLVSTEGISSGTELLFEESFDGKSITEYAVVKSYSGTGIKLDVELDHKYRSVAGVFKRTRLEVSDNTDYLTKRGTLEFIGPSEQRKTRKFGKECYWLMGSLVNLTDVSDLPLIRGIYPNTVWAEQVETIKDAIIGSSEGEKSKSYKFIKSPVLSPEIWIRETLSKEEKATLSKEEIPIREIKDDTEQIKETWVRWTAVENFYESGPRSRHCIIDGAMGEVLFGDGINGMIPPVGKDNIKTNYKSGGGVKGNVAKAEIKILKTSVASVDRVINPEPAEGGADTELVDAVLERGPHLIKHRDRAVTEEDFERLARAASSYIARTKCFTKGGKLDIIVIPKGEEDKPMPSAGLLKMVENYLRERSLNLILPVCIEVQEPAYKEINVTVDVVPESIDQAIPLEKVILKRLKEFLHPLTGGHKNSGWEFGRDVHISDIYALLEGIKGVEHVENLKLNDKSEDVKVKEFRTVCSREHRIIMKLGGQIK
uniref:Uncharacterized protein n=1 Tax=Candidatus Methanophagaceae archaeon ANME-1 ERB6 TaxID=2759912 RepID=A0A7G9YSP2_9EURY|nr:hypothetical protein EDLMLJLI_00019 [Methanosarcinales archaeon ANME-1 ERB6]